MNEQVITHCRRCGSAFERPFKLPRWPAFEKLGLCDGCMKENEMLDAESLENLVARLRGISNSLWHCVRMLAMVDRELSAARNSAEASNANPYREAAKKVGTIDTSGFYEDEPASLAQLAAEQGVKPCEDISKMELDVPEAAEMFEGMEAAKVCVWRKSAWKWWYGSCRATLDSSPNITWNRCPYCGKPIRIEKGAKP